MKSLLTFLLTIMSILVISRSEFSPAVKVNQQEDENFYLNDAGPVKNGAKDVRAKESNSLSNSLGNERDQESNYFPINSNDDEEGVTVEIEEESDFNTEFPPQLPTPDKFVSPQDLIGILGKGLEAAKTVADLVSQRFGSQVRRNDVPKNPDPDDVRLEKEKIKLRNEKDPLLATLSGFFNLIGVDRKKITTLAVNSLVVLVHLVVNNLLKNGEEYKKSDKPPEGTIYSWIFGSSPPQLKDLLDQIQQPGVEERIIGLVRESSTIDSDCVQLLLCRLAPVIWGMQKALTHPPPQNWSRLSPVDRMYAYFPSFEELVRHRPRCEIRFPNCRIKYKNLYEDLESKINFMHQ